MKSRRSGLRKSRGIAEVKYQCQGDVPQAEAPRLPSAGKTLDQNAASSGHSHVGDCQKKVSVGTVQSSPATVAEMAAGRKTVRTRLMADFKPDDLKSRYRQWDASRRANSERKIILVNVSR